MSLARTTLHSARYDQRMRMDPRVLSQPRHEIRGLTASERRTAYGEVQPMDRPGWSERHPLADLTLRALGFGALLALVVGGGGSLMIWSTM